MLVLKTSLAILISFLALKAYKKILSPFFIRRARKSDTETKADFIFNPLFGKEREVGVSTKECTDDPVCSANIDLESYKQFFFKLHNLEKYPEILPQCRDLLLTLFTETLADSINNSAESILSIPRFSKVELEKFLKAQYVQTTEGWEAYLARRKTGGKREMFADVEEARWWIKQAAPVKYVDGAWLGHINKITTPFSLRHITKNAWQVMSEELGDGDLHKNHIHVYRELLKDIKAGLPEADSEDFINPKYKLNEVRVWKAAVAQLLISLFPGEYLPEILGFNMAYECLPLHLMKTVKELDELRLNSYYFVLHISIDNSDTGHAAMAMLATVEYIEQVAAEAGAPAAHSAWKRVQAGYLLAEGLPTTPESPSMKSFLPSSLQAPQPVSSPTSSPLTIEETAAMNVFKAKSRVAQKIHCNSRLKIGRHTLVEWLDPKNFMELSWQLAFMDDLSNRKPWVVKGRSDESRLVQELSWQGRMFGSFTQNEVEVVRRWIDSLNPETRTDNAQIFHNFTGHRPTSSLQYLKHRQDGFKFYPVFGSMSTPILKKDSKRYNSLPLQKPLLKVQHNLKDRNLGDLIAVWFVSGCLLESFVSLPVRVSNVGGSAIVKILRAQYGYDVERDGVSGTDELCRTNEGKAIGLVEIGIDMYRKSFSTEPKNLAEVFTTASKATHTVGQGLIDLSMKPLEFRDTLVGMTWAFMELHEDMERIGEGLLSTVSLSALNGIALRERQNLIAYIENIHADKQRLLDFWQGCNFGRDTIDEILQGVTSQ